jgi:hypothetical protein
VGFGSAAMADAFEEFYIWVGVCITEWAHVEDWLFMTCRRCLRTRNDLASIVYYRTPQLESRLKLVDELVKANLPERKKKNGGHDHPDIIEWKRIEKEITRLLSTRRRIAHQPMRGNIDFQSADGSWVHIEMSFAESLRNLSASPDPLQKDDLVKHSLQVQTVTAALKTFYEKTLPKHRV